jgi:hypothetical protein
VCANEHLAELGEVAVLLIVHLDDTPRIFTTTDLASVRGGELVCGTHDSERNLGHDFAVLSNGLLIIKLIPGTLEDLDTVVADV